MTTAKAKKSAVEKEAEPTVTQPSKSRWPWGVWSTLAIALIVFIAPQYLIGFFMTSEQIDEFLSGDNIRLNFTVLVLGELITFGFLLAILRSAQKSLKDIYVSWPRLSDVSLAVPTYLMYLLASTVALRIASTQLSSETLDQEQNIGFEAQSAAGYEVALIFVGLVIFVPFLEELLFRGFVLKGFVEAMGWLPAAILSSLLFGLAHQQLNVGIDTTVLAMFAALLVYSTKNLWPAVLLHALKNFLAFLFLFGYLESGV